MATAPAEKPLLTSREIFNAYKERSWRANVERQESFGAVFVAGERNGPYMWNIEHDHQLIDCGTAGGVHSFGHHNEEVVGALRAALDESRDTGLWLMPSLEYLRLQDRLTELAPTKELCRSLITLASTASVDMATSFAFRFTGRQKMLAYQHGYHGHSGFAGLLTGSHAEGIIDHYNMPAQHVGFMEKYGDPSILADVIRDEYAALIIEPMDYETFAPAPAGFLEAVQAECRKKGVLFIVDETRTALGRTGKLWATEHYQISPDMLITGKGFSGGTYPVSALLTREDIYEACMNSHEYSYISSLGGNEFSCIVGHKVLDMASRLSHLEHVNAVSAQLEAGIRRIANDHSDIIRAGTFFGMIATIEILDPDQALRMRKQLFDAGVLIHSVSIIEPTVLKFFPCLTMTTNQIDELLEKIGVAVSSFRDSVDV